MIEIKKSQIDNEQSFVQAIDRHKSVLKDWQDHMRRVDSDALNEKIKPIDKHAPYKRPVAHPLIEQVMQHNGEYKIVPDPIPVVSLEDQKQSLLVQLNESHVAASAKVLTLAKRDLYLQRVQSIHQSESQKSVSWAKKFIGKIVPSMDTDKRSPEDEQFLQDFSQRNVRLNELHTKLIQARSDIEDLTIDTIKSWKNPEFT